MKICAFGASDKRILLDIFSLTRGIVSISMRNKFVLKIKDKKNLFTKNYKS